MKKAHRIAGFAAGLAISVSAVVAQPGGRGFMGGGENIFSPAVTPSELDTYADILELNEEQRAVADILLEGYMQQFQTRATDARARVQRLTDEARESRDRERWAAIGEFRDEFEAEGERMEDALFSDLRAVLTPEQAERWEDVERTRRRQRTLGSGQMSGERVDIVRLTREIELSEESRAEIRDVVRQYELDLDRVLVQRNDAYEEIRGSFGGRDGFDREAMADLFEKGREASSRVRDVNERYARQIAGLLPEDARAQFEQRVREASFPQVYRETMAQRSLAAAAGFEDLSEQQRDRITALRDKFQREASTLNDQLASKWREAEDSMEIRDMFRGGFNRGELGELRESREDLDRQYMEQLRGILTEDQLDRLPRDEDRRDFRGGRGRRGEII